MSELPPCRNPLQLCECGCDLGAHKNYDAGGNNPATFGRCMANRCHGKTDSNGCYVGQCDGFSAAREPMVEIVFRAGRPVVLDRDGLPVQIGDVVTSAAGEVSLRLSPTDVVFATMGKYDREQRLRP